MERGRKYRYEIISGKANLVERNVLGRGGAWYCKHDDVFKIREWAGLGGYLHVIIQHE